ncbi:MAG: M20/M25/M40 family metallo-hydrolase [Oligoflexus sp.]
MKLLHGFAVWAICLISSHAPAQSLLQLEANKPLAMSKERPVVWQNANFKLRLTNQALSLAPDSLASRRIAILSPTSWSDLAHKLRQDPRTILYAPMDFALQLTVVELTSQEQLDELAIAVHENRGMCGAIEVLSLDQRSYILDEFRFPQAAYASRADFPQLNDWLDAVDSARLFQRILELEESGNRFHATPEGLAATAKIASWFTEEGAALDNFTVSTVGHDFTEQQSVVARITGSSRPDEVVIIGAHLDSIARNRSLAPGADDNASGIASLLEVLRILAAHGLQPQRTIEFHAYAAEEIGLIGSRDLAQSYRSQNKQVVGMMQIDMNHWGNESDLGQVYLLTNDTSTELRRRARNWLKHYIGDDYQISTLISNATSDHKAWYDQAYPTLFAFENPLAFNPQIHTAQDSSDRLNNPQLARRITQLALIFAIYSAGTEQLDASYEAQKEQLFPLASDPDLFVAAIQAADGHHLAISAPANTASVEICVVEARLDTGCIKERRSLQAQDPRNDRMLFYDTEVFDLQTENIWRIEAYDQDDRFIAIRQLILEAAQE